MGLIAPILLAGFFCVLDCLCLMIGLLWVAQELWVVFVVVMLF